MVHSTTSAVQTLPPPAIAPVTCPCGWYGPPRLSWQTIQDGRRQIRRECPRCQRFLCFAARIPAHIAAADAAEQSPLPEPAELVRAQGLDVLGQLELQVYRVRQILGDATLTLASSRQVLEMCQAASNLRWHLQQLDRLLADDNSDSNVSRIRPDAPHPTAATARRSAR